MEAMVLSERMVKIGRVVKPHGTDGRVVVQPFTDSCEDFTNFDDIRIDGCVGSLLSFQEHSRRLICRIEGVTDRNRAEELRGSFLLATNKTATGLGHARGCTVTGGPLWVTRYSLVDLNVLLWASLRYSTVF